MLVKINLSNKYVMRHEASEYDRVNIFYFRFFFMNHLPPSPWKKYKGHLEFFSKIRGGIRNSRCNTGINDTAGNCATSDWKCFYRIDQPLITFKLLFCKKLAFWKRWLPIKKTFKAALRVFCNILWQKFT